MTFGESKDAKKLISIHDPFKFLGVNLEAVEITLAFEAAERGRISFQSINHRSLF